MMTYFNPCPKPEKRVKEARPSFGLRQKKEKRELQETKQSLFANYEPRPSKSDRAEFPASVVKSAIERSGGICEACRCQPCSSTHHVRSRNRGGRGVLSNAFRSCGLCHMEIEGSEELKQALMEEYRQRYGEYFYFDDQDWEEHRRKQDAAKTAEAEASARMERLEPIVTLLSTAANRPLRKKEMLLLDRLDERQRVVFANLMHDVVAGTKGTAEQVKTFGYGHFED